jgi:hypothetical protein
VTWRAGFGSADITPSVPVSLAGFSARTGPADAVHDRLEARAVYLANGSRAVCLIVTDLLGMTEGFSDPVRHVVADELGFEPASVLTAATHTHNGPNALEGGEALGWATPEGYAGLLEERCLAAARAARDAAEPVTLHAAAAPLPAGLSLNRRGHPYDPWFTALDARRADGSRVGAVANVAIHPVVMGSPWLRVSTDWVGPFRSALESAGGGTAVMLSGALGDVNPIEHHQDDPVHLSGAVAEAEALGRAVADAVEGALGAASPVRGDGLAVASRSVTVPTGATLLTQILGTAEATVELVEWAIGDVRLVSVPGEPFHALGRWIRDARPGITLIAGLAPVWSGYFPVPFGDGYEELVSLGAAAVEAIADAVVEGALAGVAS